MSLSIPNKARGDALLFTVAMVFLNFDLGCDLGKEFVQRLDRSDCAF